VVLGLSSNGVHSNGFSLVRKVIERAAQRLPAELDGQPFRQAIMAPTRLYVKPVLAALKAHPAGADGGIKALAHITGGGLLENIPRVLPDGLGVNLHPGSWPRGELFVWLQSEAGIDDTEMNRTFNNGIGMVLVVPAHEQAHVRRTLSQQGERVHLIGEVVARTEGAPVQWAPTRSSPLD
jgi:phosphoribosylformylglycinamidine cyclo-ligase